MPFLIAIFAFLALMGLRIGLLLLAAWILVLSVPAVLADIDHFWGWFGILVALGAAIGSGSAKVSTN